MLPQEEGWAKLAFSFRLCLPHAKPFPPQPWGSRELSSLEEPAPSQMSHWGNYRHAFPHPHPHPPPQVSPGARELQQAALGAQTGRSQELSCQVEGWRGHAAQIIHVLVDAKSIPPGPAGLLLPLRKRPAGVTQSFSYSPVFCGLSSPSSSPLQW